MAEITAARRVSLRGMVGSRLRGIDGLVARRGMRGWGGSSGLLGSSAGAGSAERAAVDTAAAVAGARTGVAGLVVEGGGLREGGGGAATAAATSSVLMRFVGEGPSEPDGFVEEGRRGSIGGGVLTESTSASDRLRLRVGGGGGVRDVKEPRRQDEIYVKK
jgi:hypothetical protein